ncbi:MAG: polyribonucleotide nucleotidyltransferase [Chloroflexota bacterium]|nr:polyribonucleotide nucleotidyltransferase [Chloroflexota bacterium]
MTNKYEMESGGRVLELEFGKIAKLANGSVTITVGETIILVTACSKSDPMDVDFLPLTVEVNEKAYAAGKIPGGFFKREARPPEEAILNARLVDRPLRPLFPKSFHNDTQIAITVLSTDLTFPYSSLGIIGASAALMVSDIPFNDPVGACEVGLVEGELIINPSYEQLAESDLQLTVAGTEDAIMMVEAGAKFVSEETLLEALELAQSHNAEIARLQKTIATEIGKDKFEIPEVIEEKIINNEEEISKKFNEIYDNSDSKDEVSSKKKDLYEEITNQILNEDSPEDLEAKIKNEFSSIEKSVVRKRIVENSVRPDKRTLNEIRELESEITVLPRVHGSSIFRRGETQALGTMTLAALSEKQKLDYLAPITEKRFMLHYNFPPYSVGETGRFMTGRREMGHGALAERALKPILPSEEDFPYTIRVVSDILGSNGSTSMASVCAGTLSLMDGGVPITEPVAGIAMGLIMNDEGKYSVLTDIQGLEDHLGDMDFKVAGSKSGVTALQMDIKIKGITAQIMKEALEQAKTARFEILDHMNETISSPKEEVSRYAPKNVKISIPKEKIGMVIGSGGSTIKEIVSEFEVTVDISDDGTVSIGGVESERIDKAIDRINMIIKDVEVGDVYQGKVVKLMDFGAFVNIMPGKDGLVHISEISDERVDSVESAYEVGQEVEVIVKKIDDQKRIDLSARVEKYLSGELSLEENKSKKFNKSKSNSKRKDVRKSNPKPPTLRN